MKSPALLASPPPTASAQAANVVTPCVADQNVGTPQDPVEPGSHIPVGTQGHWLHDPPSSGQHWSQVPPWGVLEESRTAQGDVLVPEWYVSSLEHGGIAVLYRDPAGKPAVVSFIHAAPVEPTAGAPKLGDVPYPKLGRPFALVAWGWLLYVDSLDDPLALRFYLAHVDHGPQGGCP